MAIDVYKFEIKSVADASELEKAIQSKQIAADSVIAVIGKTEGNGGVNDFTRMLSDDAFRKVLRRHGKRGEAEIKEIPMVWSGGCDGVITPHATVFAKNGKAGGAHQMRLTIGTAMSDVIRPEDIGRPAMVEKVAKGVRRAMKNAGITDPKDVHYVQTKSPLLTIDRCRTRITAARTLRARCTIPWAFRTVQRPSALPSPLMKLRCRKPRTSAATSICILRSRLALPELNSIARRSFCSATKPAQAGATKLVIA